MAITKTKQGTYRLRLYIPEEARPLLRITSKNFEKRYKTRQQGKKEELYLLNKINLIENGEFQRQPTEILFSDFYKNVWLEPYKEGQTTSTIPP